MAAATFDEGLSELKGRVLSSVEFVQDYMQLRFDGPVLTTYTLPTVSAEGTAIAFGDPEYRNRICAEIGREVRATGLDKDVVAIQFTDGAEFRISLRDEDYRGPEAVQFQSEPGQVWIL
jgi:hypothetical protein